MNTKILKQKLLAELLNNEEWKTVKLGEVCSHNTGKTLDKNRNTGTLRDYITTSNLYWDNFDFTEVRQMLIEDGELERCTAVKGDLLVCEGGDGGRSAIWKSEEPICFQNHIHRVRPKDNNFICNEFLFYFMQYLYLSGRIKDYLKGVGIQSLSGQSLASIKISLPPLIVQRQIVARIEEIFVEINRIEQSRERLLQAVKTAKQKVLTELLNNDEWKTVKLREVCDVKMGQSPDGQSVSNDASGIEFHQGKICFSDKFLKESNVYTSQSTRIAEANSLLLCVRAPVGVVNITERKICIGRGLCAINPKQDVDMMFVYYWLQTMEQEFNEKATGTTFKAISGDIIKNTEIPFPSLAIQKAVVEQIERFFAEIEKIERAIKN